MTSTGARVTVLVPTYNRSDYLAECLDSLLAQTLRPSQIILIDDGSTDRTRQVFAPYRDRVEYLQTPQGGKSVSLNRGLEETRGDYVWIFDDDDVALPDALERFVEPLERDPGLGFSHSTYFFTATKPDSRRIGEVLFEEIKPDLEKRGFLIPLLEFNILGGAALFARTACYKTVGPFDPALIRSQDYEMAIRIARVFKGAPVRGGATFHYRQHSGARGNHRDRFAADRRRKKWWEYDQMIFRKLYHELPLSSYLPPAVHLEENRREALLERLSVMVGKLLTAEALRDIRKLVRLGDTTPLSDRERDILRSLAKPPFYDVGSVLDDPTFVKAVRKLATGSPAAALFKTGLLQALWASLWGDACLRQKPGQFKRWLTYR